jgi:hypothetical protein
MRHEVVRIRGQSYVTLEAVAECYQVEVTWIEEVYEVGLLGTGEPVQASMLDRMGRILRLQRQAGLNVAGILAALRDAEV